MAYICSLQEREAKRRWYATPEGAASRSKNRKDFYQKHPERKRAHMAVYRALKRGTLKRGVCEKCSKQQVQAHHDDYSKPLEVRWLCFQHHQEAHNHKTLVAV